MTANYYSKVLRLPPWLLMPECVTWLQRRCDSALEVMFAISFLHQYATANPGCRGMLGPEIRPEAIRLAAPFAASPTGRGLDVAWLTAQHRVHGRRFDFCIHTAADPTAPFTESTPQTLLEIDGYNIHRPARRRRADEEKRAGDIPIIRFPEESFINIHQMARTALFATVWSCPCSGNGNAKTEPPAPAPAASSCEYCGDLAHRLVRFGPERICDDPGISLPGSPGPAMGSHPLQGEPGAEAMARL